MSDGLGQLQRASASEVPQARHWHLRAVFEIETQRIDGWLRAAAIQNLGPERSTSESALEVGRSLPETIRASLGIDQKENRDPLVKVRAENGALEKASPSRTWLRSFWLLKWLFLSAEIGLFVLQWLLGVSSGVVILHGLVLAFAAFLFGWGAGMIGVDPQLGGGVRNPRVWAAIVGGGIGVFGIALLRSSSGGEGVWVVILFTLLLATLIIVFEAFHVHGTAVYEDNLRQMFQGQQWVAKDQHTRDWESGLWWKTYERFVSEIAHGRDKPRSLRDEQRPEIHPNIPRIEEKRHGSN